MKVVFSSIAAIKLLKLLVTQWQSTAIMFPYKFLKVTGTAMEKS